MFKYQFSHYNQKVIKVVLIKNSIMRNILKSKRILEF